jgi:hypothetical protein|tara:strand:- start:1175 stop:1408 length:234 start_codon:yes stop_codon:yes gene_type:complete
MAQQPPQQPQLDLSKTTSIETPSGSKIWSQGVILRKVSKFIIGADEDALVPIPVFYDPETGEIMTETLPKELREEYK